MGTKFTALLLTGFVLFLGACSNANSEAGTETIPNPDTSVATTQPTVGSQATTTTEPITTTETTTTPELTTTTFRFVPPTLPPTPEPSLFEQEPNCNIEDISTINHEDDFTCSTTEVTCLEDGTTCETNYYSTLKSYTFSLEGNLRLVTSYPLSEISPYAEVPYCEIIETLVTSFKLELGVYRTFMADMFSSDEFNRNRWLNLTGEVEYREENGMCRMYAKKLLAFSRTPPEQFNYVQLTYMLSNTQDPSKVAYHCNQSDYFCYYYVFPVPSS